MTRSIGLDPPDGWTQISGDPSGSRGVNHWAPGLLILLPLLNDELGYLSTTTPEAGDYCAGWTVKEAGPTILNVSTQNVLILAIQELSPFTPHAAKLCF